LAVSPVLLDTGVVVALLDRSERYHEHSAAVVRDLGRPLVTCEAVIAESCYLLRNSPGAAEAIIENVETGVFLIPFQLSRSAAPIRRALRKYRNVPISFADACLIHLAEELGSADILTLDSDFAIYRWGKNKGFHPLISL
jgi:uncharacterized protein